MVFQGNGWRIDNRYPEMVEVGINPSFVRRLEELMRQYDTPTLEFIIFRECPVEMGAGQGLYCVGLKSTGEWGCPCRVLVSKGRVLLYPEPGGRFDLLRKETEETGYTVDGFYDVLLVRAIMGSDGPEILPLFYEFFAQKAVIVKLNYLGK